MALTVSWRYTASSIVAVAYGRRITDIETDSAYKRLQANLDFMIKMNVPGAQCEVASPRMLSPT